jgi:hypothetical protein
MGYVRNGHGWVGGWGDDCDRGSRDARHGVMGIWNRFQWWGYRTVVLVALAKMLGLGQIIRMRDLPKTGAVAACWLLLVSLGCQGSIDGAAPGSGAGSTSGSNLGGGAALPSGTQATALLPARIRRLTNAELEASVADVLGATAAQGLSGDFVPDSRQSGFTVNDAQRVDPVYAGQLADAAKALSAQVRIRATELAPCESPASGAAACAETFIRSFGERAYRRPLGADEVTHLQAIFATGADGGSYEEGIELVARAMLQSAAFIYLTEIGDAPAATIKLTPRELASAISYLIQGRPPQADLVASAESGELDSAEGRFAAVNSLLSIEARDRVVRVIREWLGIDRIADTAKDSNAYPEFARVKDAMAQETTEFIQVLVAEKGGSLGQLLGGDFTLANRELAQIYGVSAPGDAFTQIAVPNRRGILQQGAFLSVYAHANETAPVLRGVAVLRRVVCNDPGDPVSLVGAVVPPVPDLTKTTRERFAVHAKDALCASCHTRIDSFGFAFEGLDGMGKLREFDNHLKIDTSVVVAGTDFDGSYADSNALVQAMATSAQVRECFARHVFRGMAGSSAPEVSASEDDFVKYWHTTPDADDVDIVRTLGTYIASPGFPYRRAQ